MDKSSELHFAFCINDGYAKYLAVTIKSICENHTTESVIIHLLTDGINLKNRVKLLEIVEPYKNIKLEIHAVNDSRLRGLKDTWSIYGWYRILIPEILSSNVHRILYLDADTIVSSNLSELFSMDMSEKSIGGVIDIESFNYNTFDRCRYSKDKLYLCSGVLLMNLDYWREHDLAQKIIKFGFDNNDRIKFPDQDTINILCQDSKITLPIKYGIQPIFLRREEFLTKDYKPQLIDSLNDTKIIHYAGCAPWIKEFSFNPLHPIWVKYNNLLKHPVKVKYQTQGFNQLKVRIWNLLHPHKVESIESILSTL